MDKKQALELLNINENAFIDEGILRKTYLRLSMTHHPDKQPLLNKTEESDSKFAEINEAYNFLLNLINSQSIVEFETKLNNDSSLRSENEELKRDIQDLRELNEEILRNKAKEISEMQKESQKNFLILVGTVIFQRAISNIILSFWFFLRNWKLEKVDNWLILKWGFYSLLSIWLGYGGIYAAAFIEFLIMAFKRLKRERN